jgi:glycosyltransferase involved in cell wall biosynthesis
LARSRERLTAIEREVAPDIVHLNGYREATAPWRAPVLVVAHSCVRSWWHACRGGEPNEPRWERYAANVEDGLNAAGEWVAPTAAFRAAVQTLYAPSRPGRVIWNGIASPRPAHGKEPFILTAGRLWDEAKNVSVLASVAANVPWPIRLAGETRTSENRGAVAPQGANDLHLLGTLRRGEVLDQMNRAAIYVAPALYEPFGLAILEAAAAGCALVLSDIATMRELWDGAALFVQARDAGALERALDRLCGDAALRMVLQRAALRRARRYSIAKTAAAYAQLYRTLEGDRALGSAPAAHRRPSAMELAQ